MRQALSDRARLVRTIARRVAGGQQPVETLKNVGLPALEGVSCEGADPSLALASSVLVVAQVDPTLALRVVDVGPAADDAKAAARFRSFWKERCVIGPTHRPLLVLLPVLAFKVPTIVCPFCRL